ncbi:hypothetical protein AB6A40_001296 [Gnathostoma spinigerum]|uniref:TFIIS central domain-containing protein n=1 Tax=Gnathostoma spinigerum TaxID=75299 RepID=A0ABD6EDL5_9BILA
MECYRRPYLMHTSYHIKLDEDRALGYVDGTLANQICDLMKENVAELPSSSTRAPRQSLRRKGSVNSPSPSLSSSSSVVVEPSKKVKRARKQSTSELHTPVSIPSSPPSTDVTDTHRSPSASESQKTELERGDNQELKDSNSVDQHTLGESLFQEAEGSNAVVSQEIETSAGDNLAAATKLTAVRFAEFTDDRKERNGSSNKSEEVSDPDHPAKDGLSPVAVTKEDLVQRYGLMDFVVSLKKLEESDIEKIQEDIRKNSASLRSNSEERSSSPDSCRGDVTLSQQLNMLDKEKMHPRQKHSASNKAGDRCHVCELPLDSCTDNWFDKLGSHSIYCSEECIRKQVEKATEMIKDPENHVMVLDRSGTMLNGPLAPKLKNLFEFLKSHVDFMPVLEPEKNVKTGGKTRQSKIDKMLSKETDQRRLQVKLAIHEKLFARSKKFPELSFTMSASKSLSKKIEEELFKRCKQVISSRYRLWFKRFILNLTDEANKGFFLRVVLGEISVQKLVSMETNDLVSKELAVPIDIPETKRAIRRPFGGTKDSNTAKMEECVESEDGVPKASKPPLLDGDGSSGNSKPKSTAVAKTKPKPVKKIVSEVDKILGEVPANTTSLHRFHLFDLNCDICTGKQERELLEKKKAEEAQKKEAKKEQVKKKREENEGINRMDEVTSNQPSRLPVYQSRPSTSHSSPQIFEETNEDENEVGFDADDEFCCEHDDSGGTHHRRAHRSSLHAERDGSWRQNEVQSIRGYDERLASEENWRRSTRRQASFSEHRSHNRRGEHPQSWMKIRSERGRECERPRDEWNNGGRENTWRRRVSSRERYECEENWRARRPLSDSWRESRDSRKTGDIHKSVEPIDFDGDRGHDASLWETEESHVVWNGILAMGQYFQFSSTLTLLSNQKGFHLREELPSMMRIIGRIQPLVVYDYLLSLRKSEAKDVIVLRLDRPESMDHNQQFIRCFMDMQRKARYSVLNLEDQPTLKDGYLIALSRGDDAPLVLQPYDGPGIPTDHPDMILCVIVRHKDIMDHPRRPLPRPKSPVNKESLSLSLPRSTSPVKVTEIPLEQKQPSLSPTSQMREFEFSLQENVLRQDTDESQPLRTSADMPSCDPAEETSETEGPTGDLTKHAHQFGSPSENEELWGGIPAEDMCTNPNTEGGDDALLPPGFFDRLRKLAPVKTPVPTINSISDLLVAIHTHTRPAEVAQLVSDYTSKNFLSMEEQELIEKAVQQKVLLERRKRGEIIADEREIPGKRRKKLNESKNESENNQAQNEAEVPLTEKDFEKPGVRTTFVGDAKTIEMGKIEKEGMAKDFSKPMPTPPPPIPPPPVAPVFPAVPLPPPYDLNTTAPPPPPPPPPPVILPVNASISSVQSSVVVYPETVVPVPSLTSESKESRNSKGEMDMDISDDDDSNENPPETVDLLPPPPPPPAFYESSIAPPPPPAFTAETTYLATGSSHSGPALPPAPPPPVLTVQTSLNTLNTFTPGPVNQALHQHQVFTRSTSLSSSDQNFQTKFEPNHSKEWNSHDQPADKVDNETSGDDFSGTKDYELSFSSPAFRTETFVPVERRSDLYDYQPSDNVAYSPSTSQYNCPSSFMSRRNQPLIRPSSCDIVAGCHPRSPRQRFSPNERGGDDVKFFNISLSGQCFSASERSEPGPAGGICSDGPRYHHSRRNIYEHRNLTSANDFYEDRERRVNEFTRPPSQLSNPPDYDERDERRPVWSPEPLPHVPRMELLPPPRRNTLSPAEFPRYSSELGSSRGRQLPTRRYVNETSPTMHQRTQYYNGPVPASSPPQFYNGPSSAAVSPPWHKKSDERTLPPSTHRGGIRSRRGRGRRRPAGDRFW